MTKTTTSSLAISRSLPTLAEALGDVEKSFDRFCLTAGLQALEQVLEEDAAELCGARHQRGAGRAGYRWGATAGPAAFHGGKVAVRRPRVRSHDGREVALPSWRAAGDEDWLGKWAMNLMLINVSTRKYARAVRLPEGDLPVAAGDGTSKSAASRRFVALSAARLGRVDGLATCRSSILLVIQIDGLHVAEDIVLVGAIGIDGEGKKHPLGLIEGATENAAVVQALIDNLIERGLDPTVRRLFIVDGAKALSKAIRRTFGADTPIQRCQVHKARNIIERCPSRPARRGAQGAAPGLGARRCGQGRAAAAQSRAPAGAGGARRGGSRRRSCARVRNASAQDAKEPKEKDNRYRNADQPKQTAFEHFQPPDRSWRNEFSSTRVPPFRP